MSSAFRSSAAAPAPPSTLPDSIDVAIIGGGIIGLSTAWELAKHGLKVAIFEKGRIAGEQSSRNWGWVRSLSRDVRELPLAAAGDAAWREIQALHDVGYRRTGLAYLANTDEDMARHAKWIEAAKPYGFRASLLTPETLAQKLPPKQRDWAGALYCESDGVAEPSLASEAIMALALDAGVSIHTDCAVRGLDIAAGRVTGVVTEHGTVRCSNAILAGGAWSRLFCGNHGIDLPQLRVCASAMRIDPLDAGLDLTLNASDFTVRRRQDGGYTVSQAGTSTADLTPDSIRLCHRFLPAWMAERKYLKLRLSRRFFEELLTPRRFSTAQPTPFEKVRTWDPAPATAMLDGALANLQQAFPSFKGARVAQAWAGMIDVTPDSLPVISAADSIPGFFIATGFSAHGFGIGPGAGGLMADIVRGVTPRVDPAVFHLSRLASAR
ncbi:FAD-binding oxidoreductase [Robbsia sp. KACC 23696]|uniref:NAD(P)/FAD-dependent oxidoreductase n=1 Tax=Robbsia sp. KACC 23696 TaxID=3149231 RepID=UPI00325A90F0